MGDKQKKPEKQDLEKISSDLRSLAVEIDTLTIDPSNARLHGEESIDAIKNSLTLFGQRRTIVVQRRDDALVVRAGNGLVEAAKALGWKYVAASIVEESDASATAYAIADNRTAEKSRWDDDALFKSLKSIDMEFDKSKLGFTDIDFLELEAKINQNLDVNFLDNPEKSDIQGEIPDHQDILVIVFSDIEEINRVKDKLKMTDKGRSIDWAEFAACFGINF